MLSNALSRFFKEESPETSIGQARNYSLLMLMIWLDNTSVILALIEGDEWESHPLVEYIFSGDAHESGQLAKFEGVSHSGVRFSMEVGAREVTTDDDRFLSLF